MPTIIHQRVRLCRRGEYPKSILRVPSGWVVLGDVQFLRGYCLILPDPPVPHLNALTLEARRQLMADASIVGDALIELTDAVRINYEILGNLEPALHVHIFPRFRNEPEALRNQPVWSYDWQAAPAFDMERDAGLMASIRTHVERVLALHAPERATP